jgi:hypothetical protein
MDCSPDIEQLKIPTHTFERDRKKSIAIEDIAQI